MIKVAIYENYWDWDNESPTRIVPLKDFEENFKDWKDGICKIKFIVE
jgi:hypothetical protein